MISGVASDGLTISTVLQGTNDSLSWKLVLCKLVEILDKIDPDWRSKYVLYWDNWQGHYKECLDLYKKLNLPYSFTAVSSMQIGLAEYFFGSCKQRRKSYPSTSLQFEPQTSNNDVKMQGALRNALYILSITACISPSTVQNYYGFCLQQMYNLLQLKPIWTNKPYA